MNQSVKGKGLLLILLLLALVSVDSFAGTTSGSFQTVWNGVVNVLSDKYVGYLVAGYLLYDAYRQRMANETGKAMERIAYASAFGGFATLATTTAGALLQ